MPNESITVNDRLVTAEVQAVLTVEAARKKLAEDPKHRPTLWILSTALRTLGETSAAEQAEIAAIQSSLAEPSIRKATEALAANRPGLAEGLVRQHLAKEPNDAAALRMLADVASRAGRMVEAEKLLRRALALAPAFDVARRELAILLHKNHRLDEAIAVVDERLAETGDAMDWLHLKSVLLTRSGRVDDAIPVSASALAQGHDSPVLWLSHGRLLATVGRREEAIAAIRGAVRLNPRFGEAWWSLADIDALSLSEADIATMTDQATQSDVSDRERTAIHFALGRAHEVRGAAATAFDHLQTAHAIRRRAAPYRSEELTRYVAETLETFGPGTGTTGAAANLSSGGPIFIVGMHRSGSTLVEQILASHPQIEGLAELPHIAELAAGAGRSNIPGAGPPLLKAHNTMSPDQAAALGRTYLDRVQPRRQTARAFYTDKMPGNWRFVPFISTILPGARIIDVRRDPLDCCVSNYCRYYAHGQNYVDDLAGLGQYYHDYAVFMRHMTKVMPETVYRIDFERLVADTEAEVRRLLDFLGLPFAPECLRFFETDRAIRTPSAQQVRQPINTRGIGRHRQFDAWLDPLKDALGPELCGGS